MNYKLLAIFVFCLIVVWSGVSTMNEPGYEADVGEAFGLFIFGIGLLGSGVLLLSGMFFN